MKDKFVFKIRRKSDGLFSTGGVRPTFNSKGKEWKNIGSLKNHILQQTRYKQELTYDGCETVKYRVQYEELGPDLSIQDYVQFCKSERIW